MMKRTMNNNNSINNNDDNNNHTNIVTNPLHQDCVPSDAYRESMRNSRRLEGPSTHNSNNNSKPKWKTLLACAILLSIGAILFLTGLGLFLSNRKGLDVLIVGCIMLLPGVYATNILLGTWLGWRGYGYDALPSFD